MSLSSARSTVPARFFCPALWRQHQLVTRQARHACRVCAASRTQRRGAASPVQAMVTKRAPAGLPIQARARARARLGSGSARSVALPPKTPTGRAARVGARSTRSFPPSPTTTTPSCTSCTCLHRPVESYFEEFGSVGPTARPARAGVHPQYGSSVRRAPSLGEALYFKLRFAELTPDTVAAGRQERGASSPRSWF